jgi:phenylalanyl-tRNA synthetase beta chain
VKFTLSWLKDHLETDCSVDAIATAMTMAGLEVEHVLDPSLGLRPFSVAKILEAVQHPNADRLRVCQVDTVEGRKEIVCGAPNARAGLTTIYAPIGAYVPGLGVTLTQKPVRGVVSDGMLCSAKELELSEEHDGIIELPADLAVGVPAASVFGADPVIDFEVTPNRPDWLGVSGIARDLAAAGVGRLITPAPAPVPGVFACPIRISLDGSDACPMFAGRLIRGVRNGPSPPWLQQRLKAVGLRPISALVDVTNLLSLDRARPLHVYDAAKITGGRLEARLGRAGERVEALDGRTYAISPEMCVIADDSGPLGLGGVMGGTSTGCSEATTEVFIESAWFDPLRTAQTGRDTGIVSDAQYRFARGVDPGFVTLGLELATSLVLAFCGGEASEVVVVGSPPEAPPAIRFDPGYVRRLSGLSIPHDGIAKILTDLGFGLEPDGLGLTVTPPTWRRDVGGPADLVEEVARIAGFDQLPAVPLPDVKTAHGGVLTAKQGRVRTARRAMAAQGYQETIGWSFVSQKAARLFGGGGDRLVLANPIASDLDCMRPSALPGLIEAVKRNRDRGWSDLAFFEIGPVFLGDQPADQRTAVSALLSSDPPRRWDGGRQDPLFEIKGDLFNLLGELGAPLGAVQLVQEGAGSWWRPGQSARLQLGPKTVLAEFGALHPKVLKTLDIEVVLYGFELWLEALPEPKRRAAKTRPRLSLSPYMPVSRDFAFVVDKSCAAGDLVRAAQGADKTLIASARIFDVYVGPGLGETEKSVALEVVLQPQDKTLTDLEIEAASSRIVAAVEKTCSARLRR